MPDTWMTVAEAAASLKVHPRTIERRIAGEKIQSRRADDGQVQVLINTPDMPDNAADTAMETVRELAVDQVSLARGSATTIVKFAQDDANRAREELSIVRHDVGRARRSVLVAWCVVAGMGLATCIAVGWTAQKIARANADLQHLNDYAEKMEREAKQLIVDRDQARKEAETERLIGAQMEGRLSAFMETAANRPTTKPSSLIDRLASAFIGD